jgi:hypothetical protein
VYQVFLEKIKSSVVAPSQTVKNRLSIMSSMPLFMNIQEKANKVEKESQHILTTLQSIIDVGKLNEVDPKELTQNLVFLSENNQLEKLNRLKKQKITLDFPAKYIESASIEKVMEAVHTANGLHEAGCDLVISDTLNTAINKVNRDKKLPVKYKESLVYFLGNQPNPDVKSTYTPSVTNLKAVSMHISPEAEKTVTTETSPPESPNKKPGA